jgi:hypothetical protein
VGGVLRVIFFKKKKVACGGGIFWVLQGCTSNIQQKGERLGGIERSREIGYSYSGGSGWAIEGVRRPAGR